MLLYQRNYGLYSIINGATTGHRNSYRYYFEATSEVSITDCDGHIYKQLATWGSRLVALPSGSANTALPPTVTVYLKEISKYTIIHSVFRNFFKGYKIEVSRNQGGGAGCIIFQVI